MGQIKLPEKAKLFIGIIGINKGIILAARHELEKLWGEIDLESIYFDFNKTSYYKEEMGDNLLKKFFSFQKLINREEIVDIKIKTNQLEESIKEKSNTPGRDVNIDPGYVTLSNITLATTKDYRHRIYLGKGIYLENTLFYDSKNKTYKPWDWTYPDYRTEGYIEFFNKLRSILKVPGL